MAATPRHVIFGTGAIGLATLDALRHRGESVRLVNRSGTAPVPDDIEVLGGDASDPAFTTAAAQGAQVVYQTLNPPYPKWVELFPGLQASVLAAAQAAGARLVSMENVYMYGRPDGQPLTETRPYAAQTKKGKLRARMARELLAPHAAGNVQVANRRASDYFGAPGEVWHLPNDPHTRTTRQLVATIYQLAGQPKTKLRSTPALLLRAVGVVNPTVRELLELQYEFQEPFVVDSTK